MQAAIELDPRRRRLRAALGFLQLPPTEPELLILHRWLDSWHGIGLIVAGMPLNRLVIASWLLRRSVTSRAEHR